MEQREKLGILVHLDDLLDTRLAVLSLIHSDIPKLALEAGYFKRDEDSFPYVPKDKFEKFYAQRNAIVLQEAIPTRVLAFLRELVLKLAQQSLETPHHGGPKIYLNVYPYDLSPAEVDLIVKVVALHTGQLCDIKAVYMAPKDISPQFCRENLGCLFLYNASEWLETNTNNEAFRFCQIPDVTVYVPALYHGRKATEEELNTLAANNLDPFRAFEISSSAIVNMCVLDVAIFCVDFDKHMRAARESL